MQSAPARSQNCDDLGLCGADTRVCSVETRLDVLKLAGFAARPSIETFPVIERLDGYCFQIDRCEPLTPVHAHAGYPVWTTSRTRQAAPANSGYAVIRPRSEHDCASDSSSFSIARQTLDDARSPMHWFYPTCVRFASTLRCQRTVSFALCF